MSTYEETSRSGAPTGGEGVKERAVEAVAEVDAGAKHVAGVAGEEAGNVAHEAKDAARGFFAETRHQLADQASTQQHRAASALRSTGDQFSEMAQGTQTNGVAAGLVRGLGEQTKNVASWLEDREPGDLVQEVRGFARRHTGAFVVAAIGVGLVAGRLTRSLMSNGSNDSAGTAGRSGGVTPPTPASFSNPGGQGATYGAGPAVGGAAGTGAAGGTPIGDAVYSERQGYGAVGGTAEPRVSGAGTDDWSATGEDRP